MSEMEQDQLDYEEEQEQTFAQQARSSDNVESQASTSGAAPPQNSARKGGPSKDSDRLGSDATKLLSHLTKYFDEKLDDFKREIVEDDAFRGAKRRRTSYDFRKKANQKNYEHNTEVQFKMEEAKRQLNKPNPNIEKASIALEKGMNINAVCNKHILIADQSEGGWATVDEYLLRDVASDSDDDKKIRKAENVVFKRKQQNRRGRGRGSFNNNFFNNNRSNNQRYNNSGNYSGPVDHAFQQYGFAKRDQPIRFSAYDKCHICNEYGHWKHACPRRFNMPSTITTSKQA